MSINFSGIIKLIHIQFSPLFEMIYSKRSWAGIAVELHLNRLHDASAGQCPLVWFTTPPPVLPPLPPPLPPLLPPFAMPPPAPPTFRREGSVAARPFAQPESFRACPYQTRNSDNLSFLRSKNCTQSRVKATCVPIPFE
jgi:hypothetical protein